MKLITELLASKKFIAMVIGVATVVVSEGITQESTNQIAAMVIAFIFAQGIADNGKSAEVLRQKAGPDNTVK